MILGLARDARQQITYLVRQPQFAHYLAAQSYGEPLILRTPRPQEMVLEVEHPGHGRVRMTGFPVKLGATPCRLRLPAPELGAHTEEVLTDLGLGAEIPRLRAQKII